MSNRRRIKPTDPRSVPGTIAGPGGPHDRGSIIVDASQAVLMDHCTVSTVDQGARGQQALAMVLAGRINQTHARAEVLFVFGTDGAAGIITELVALLGRAGAMDADGFLTDLVERVERLRADGNLS